MVTDVFIGAGTSNTSKQHMISLHNRNKTSSRWTNQLITLQRVFSAFPRQMWHSVGPLVPHANVHMGHHLPQHLLTSDASASLVTAAWHLQVLGSAPGPWGIRPNSRLGEIVVRLKSVGCLFIWLKEEETPLLQNKECKASPWAWTCSWLCYFTYICYKAWPIWKIALLLSNPNYREN